MGRKNRGKHHHGGVSRQQPARYFVSLDKWQRFQEHEERIANLEKAAQDLQEAWLSHLDEAAYLTGTGFSGDAMDDAIIRIVETVRELAAPAAAAKPQYGKKKKKKGGSRCQIAELVIEDISNGRL